MFSSLLSHRTSFQLEWLHQSWGGLAEHLPALHCCCPGQGQPCRAPSAPALGSRPGGSSSPRAFSPVATCSTPPASAPASWQITLVASEVSASCLLGAAFCVLVAARLAQTVLAELCWSFPRRSAVTLHAPFRWVVLTLSDQVQGSTVKLCFERAMCVARFSV